MASVISTDKIHETYSGVSVDIITRASFEDRWVKCLNSLGATDISSITIFSSPIISQETSDNLERINHDLSPLKHEIKFKNKDPDEIFNTFEKVLFEYFSENSGNTILIDISSFRREELFMILFLLKIYNNEFPNVICNLIYMEVDRMSDEWLSRNTQKIRSVLGYSGDPQQSKRTCLVVMVGHELNRAKDIIDAYDPSRLLIGKGLEEESINEELHKKNNSFYSALNAYYGEECSSFEFSLLDPIKVRDLLRGLCSDEKYNYVIAPLNNKISCIGVGLFALEEPDIQVCYSYMLDYNKPNYSSSGNNIHVMNIHDFWGR